MAGRFDLLSAKFMLNNIHIIVYVGGGIVILSYKIKMLKKNKYPFNQCIDIKCNNE